MARLYANENFPLPVVEQLRRLGHDALTIQEAGKADQSLPDEAVLEFARADGRAILTLNRSISSGCTRSNRTIQASSFVRLILTSTGRPKGFT